MRIGNMKEEEKGRKFADLLHFIRKSPIASENRLTAKAFPGIRAWTQPLVPPSLPLQVQRPRLLMHEFKSTGLNPALAFKVK